MKAKSRRQFTSEFKVKLVLEVLRQEKTLTQIASENDLHPQLLQTAPVARLEAGIYDRCSASIRPTKGSRKASY